MSEFPNGIVRSEYPDASVASVGIPAEGNRKRTAVVTLDDGRRVVVQASDDPDGLATETRLIREIADRTSVPVPAVLAAGREGATGYRITEYVEGENLHERFVSLPADDRRHLAGQFGRLLAELHATFRLDRFGALTVENGTVRAAGPDDWANWFGRYTDSGLEALPDAFSDLRVPIRERLADRSSEQPTPRLYPWDLRPGNALVQDGEIVAVPDWDGPLAASAGLGVAKVEHLLAEWYVDDPEPLRAAFRDGYRSVKSLPEATTDERLVAVVRSAVDSHGEVTRPGYPERTGDDAVAFHRDRLESLL